MLAQQKNTKQGYKRKVFTHNIINHKGSYEVEKIVKFPRIKKNKKTYREISSGDDDNDDEYKDKEANVADICFECEEFGKNGEI